MVKSRRTGFINMERLRPYMIFAGCIILYMLLVGEVKAYGVIYTEMLSVYGSGAGKTGWIGGICFFLAAGLSPFTMSLCNKLSYRKVTFVGGLLVSAGHIASAFTPNIDLMYLTYGIIVGIGYGAILAPSSVIPSHYFEQRRYLANGILLASSGLWAIALSFIIKFLLEIYGLSGTFLIIGAVQLHMCAAACLLMIDTHDTEQNKDNCVDDNKSQSSILNQLVEETLLYLRMFKQARFCIYLTSVLMFMLVDMQNNILVTAPLQSMGYSKTDEAINVSIMNGCNIAARLFFGWISDKRILTAKSILIINSAISSIMSFFGMMFASLIYTRIYSVVLGTFIASYPALLPPLLIDAFGLDKFGKTLSVMFVCGSFANLLAQPIAGWTKDETGTWDTAFAFVGGALAIASINLFLESWSVKLCTKNTDKTKKSDGNIVHSTRL